MSSSVADAVRQRKLAGQRLREWYPQVRSAWLLLPLSQAIIKHNTEFAKMHLAAPGPPETSTVVVDSDGVACARDIIQDTVSLLPDGFVLFGERPALSQPSGGIGGSRFGRVPCGQGMLPGRSRP